MFQFIETIIWQLYNTILKSINTQLYTV